MVIRCAFSLFSKTFQTYHTWQRMALLFGLLGGLFFALIVVGCARGVRSKPPPAFSHKQHLEEGSVCDDCHTGVAQSRSTATLPPLPQGQSCLECHDALRAAWKRKPLFRRVPRALHFSHKQHQKPSKKRCLLCHKKSSKSSRVADRLLPSMENCLQCHRSWLHKKHCARCHKNLFFARLRPISYFSHKGNWLRRHRRQARSRTGICWKCHDQPFCADCHSKVAKVRPSIKYADQPQRAFIHRGSFLGRHSIKARLQPELCRKCHGLSSCQACHRLKGVASSSRHPRSPHPVGWMQRGHRQHHGSRARRRPALCQTCHDRGPQTACIHCHRPGGIGGKPHPPGWKGRRGFQPRRSTPCRYCHL